ncbi:MAG: SBBP repeat-containing protein [Chthoniobacteraceae bacterium]
MRPIERAHLPGIREPEVTTPDVVLRLKLKGASEAPRLVGDAPLAGAVNYLRGSSAGQWRTNIRTYGRVRYAQVYPGVDLVYYGTHGQLECDFVLQPGADPAAIGWQFSGADAVSVDPTSGDLKVATAAGTVRWHRPLVYQEISGQRRAVAANYVASRDGSVGFQLAAYDRRQPLVIDPVLVYSTYLGLGTGPQGSGLAVDSAGNVYLAGETDSAAFPTTSGAVQRTFMGGNNEKYGGNDVYVAKLNPAGNGLVYSTYVGGTGSDWALALALDSAAGLCHGADEVHRLPHHARRLSKRQ